MSKNSNLTQLDANQIRQKEHDVENDARRVVIVGGGDISFSVDSDKLVNAIKDGLKNITTTGELSISNVPAPVVETIAYSVPQIEYRTIEVPVIVKEIEYREVEKPIYIERLVTVDKPVIIKEIEFKTIEIYKERYYPFVLKASAVIQAICIIGILLINILKK